MPKRKTAFWNRPIVGAVMSVGGAVWAGVQSGDLSPYLTLPVFVILLGICQVIWALLHERNELREMLENKKLRKSVARKLGLFLGEWDELQKPERLLDHPARDSLNKRVEQLFVEEPLLGIDFIGRYRSGAGIAPEFPVGFSEEQQRWFAHGHTRRVRLEEFIKWLNPEP